MRRPLVVLLSALLLAACFGDDDGPEETVGTDPTVEPDETEPADPDDPPPADLPPVVAEACSVFAGDVVRIAGEPEQPAEIEELRTALEGLAVDGPDEVRDDAAQLLVALRIAAVESQDELVAVLEEMGEEAYMEALYGSVLTAEELVAWAAPTCAPGELAWSCASPASSILVATMNTMAGERGEADGAEEPEAPTTEPEPVLDSAEAVIAEVDRDTEPVDISRTEDRVEVAWLDEKDLVAATVVAERTDGGWARTGGDECTNRED